MSKFATGRVLDLDGQGIAGLNIDVEDVSQLHDGQVLNQDQAQTTDSSGAFHVEYKAYAFNTTRPGAQARDMRLAIRLGRLLVKEVFKNEGAFGDTLDFGDISVARADADGWRPSLGTGKPTRTSTGNAIRWLADNTDGWNRAADVINSATTLDVMQLVIDIDQFKTDKPKIVLHFEEVDNNSGNALALDPKDSRIERAILDRIVNHNAVVRIQIPRISFDPKLMRTLTLAAAGTGVVLALGAAGLFLLAGILLPVLAIVAVALGVVLAIGAGLAVFLAYFIPTVPQYLADWYSSKFGEPALQQWFNDAKVDSAHMEVRQLADRSFNITHAKVLISRDQEAILLGSPFEQVYYDSPKHEIAYPKRGGAAAKGPIHDVSVAVRGPALKDVQELFNSHWKVAEPSDSQTAPNTPGAVSAGTGEFGSTVQLILTLDRLFNGPGETDGEKGVLEAYLRAIHFADRFIYIENQYFHNPRIAQALTDAMLAKPKLAVILLINVSPDMPYYLRWQRNALNSITGPLVKKYGKDAVKSHFRVFSTFSHQAPDSNHPNPRLVDNYLHTKTSIVDNVWATVGSANLDGASLDAEDYFKSAVDGEVRHTEANLLIYEDPPAISAAVDALRRRLWAEHLGILVNNQPGVLDTAASELNDSPATDWLAVWNQKAESKLAGIKTSPNVVSPIRILPVDHDYGPDFDGLGKISRFLGNTKVAATVDHYALKSYLRSVFNEDTPPKRKLEDFDLTAPDNFPFRKA